MVLFSQREKEQIENALSTELDEARQKIVHLQSVQDQLRKEISEKQDLRVAGLVLFYLVV